MEKIMITEIGVVSGEILELLEQRNGFVVFSEIKSVLQESHDMVLMSLGWLLREGHVQVMEDALTAPYHKEDIRADVSEVCMNDLVIAKNVSDISPHRIKHMSEHIDAVSKKILFFLKKCGDLSDLPTIEANINEHRDIILMGLGWLIREEFVKGVVKLQNVYIIRLNHKKEDVASLNELERSEVNAGGIK